ncbi:MAG: peroxiredoxin [Paracoccaceae bacterium]
MTISQGDTLPSATLLQMGANGPEPVLLDDKVKGRRVVIFGLPGAFTSTCTSAHVPSFIRTKDQFDAKGVDEIICIAVNDPHVMKAWGQSTGATAAGLTFLADADSSFTGAIGMQFDAPAAGFHKRSIRYAMIVEDGVVKFLNREEQRGVCEMTAGETLLEQV